jgi:hypothetical protein
MDKFAEMLQKMQQMSDAERKATLDAARAKCICTKCLTYNECMKGKQDALFCVTGKTGCAPVKKGCICVTCPVTPMMGLKNALYCTRGSEKEIRKL